MTTGTSGRIVLLVDTSLKRALYSELAREGKTLKDWFVAAATQYIQRSQQPDLFDAEPRSADAGRSSSR